jgi:hypothetical protein
VLFLAHEDLQCAALGYYLGEVGEADFGGFFGGELDAEDFEGFRVEAATGAEFREVGFEAVEGCGDFEFEGCEVGGVVYCCWGGGLGFELVARGFGTFF